MKKENGSSDHKDLKQPALATMKRISSGTKSNNNIKNLFHSDFISNHKITSAKDSKITRQSTSKSKDNIANNSTFYSKNRLNITHSKKNFNNLNENSMVKNKKPSFIKIKSISNHINLIFS